MSMNYGIVRPSFWTGATGRALRQDVDAQVVAMYLMTSPHANIIGVFRCPVEFIKIETGRTIEGASKGLTKLCELDFCTVDPETETVWVHEMARYQIGDALKGGDKRIKHVARFFNEIENPHIKRAFFEKYGSAYHLQEPPISEPTASPFKGASKGDRSPIEATVTVTDTVTSVPSERAPVAPPDPEKELFDRGKQVLGKSAGGQIVKLKNAKGGNVALARAAIEQASTKQNPAEYIAAVIRGGVGPPAFGERQTNGFVAVMEERSREQQHGQSGFGSIIDVTPNQPSGSGGPGTRPQLLGRG
ncbi:hypothetical protein HNR60_000676 [Rhodopseudomonas rhenobacensis]|uniref:Uncharacterized protein n=1 Tax=Rhodopseudomonas rhenobacensis TaxID=87461 RepID=A0A7W7Z0W6_9BRAD|nr:hypothetical protein [Rhodopseudomonas rhenobacensis]MBB5045941.1 hypothetical protein [Rhodopseudomonas rhenobacensis]